MIYNWTTLEEQYKYLISFMSTDGAYPGNYWVYDWDTLGYIEIGDRYGVSL